MANIELEVELQGWQQGDKKAFAKMHDWLKAKFLPFAARYLRPFVGDDDCTDNDQITDEVQQDPSAEGDEQTTDEAQKGPSTVANLACDAFSRMLEELSLRVEESDDKLLAVRVRKATTTGDKTLEADDAPDEVKVFRGKVTRRLFEEREQFTWQGEKAFESLCRQILIRHCVQVRRDHYRRQKDISLDSNVHAEEQRGASYSERIVGSVSEGETLLVQGQAVYGFVEGLAQFSEQLRSKGREAESETIETLLLYVKSKAAQTNPAYAEVSVEELRPVPIERLLPHSAMCALDSDEEDAWLFVEHTLKLNRETVYQRKRRLCRQVQSLPVPDSLRVVVSLLWLRDMRHWVEDCPASAGRVDEDEAAMLHMVEVFLRWLFAKGHPSHSIRLHRGACLKWLEHMPSKMLFTSNNPQLLKPTYPGAGDFRRFVIQYYPNTPSAVTELSRL